MTPTIMQIIFLEHKFKIFELRESIQLVEFYKEANYKEKNIYLFMNLVLTIYIVNKVFCVVIIETKSVKTRRIN
jgi:hypothetical protein